MQGLWLRYDDELRRGLGGDPVTERLHSWQQSPPGLLQDKQGQSVISGADPETKLCSKWN